MDVVLEYQSYSKFAEFFDKKDYVYCVLNLFGNEK